MHSVRRICLCMRIKDSLSGKFTAQALRPDARLAVANMLFSGGFVWYIGVFMVTRRV
ncbi:hypothetical protein CPB83DRAFT_862926, partial [Crepidotus variabilis]